jgi:hypothetical protein
MALYLPDQGDVAREFTEKIWDHNMNLEMVANELIKKYGPIEIGINDFPVDENGFTDVPYYFIDNFNDLK